MDLTLYPQIALVIFLGIFVGVIYRVFSKEKTKDYEEASRLPLDE